MPSFRRLRPWRALWRRKAQRRRTPRGSAVPAGSKGSGRYRQSFCSCARRTPSMGVEIRGVRRPSASRDRIHRKSESEPLAGLLPFLAVVVATAVVIAAVVVAAVVFLAAIVLVAAFVFLGAVVVFLGVGLAVVVVVEILLVA